MDEDDSNSDEDVELSTPEFVKEAAQAGFSLDQLHKAEQALDSGKVTTSEDLRLPKLILSKMVQRKAHWSAMAGAST